MVSHSSHVCAACCAFFQGVSVQGADTGDLHKFNMPKRGLVARKTMCFDSAEMTESAADQELTVDGGAGDVLPKHDVGDGATNQDDVGRSAVMSSADSTASSATLSSTATTEQLHLRAERRYDLHVASLAVADDVPAKRPKYDASHDDDCFSVSVCDILAGVSEVQSVAAAQQHEEEPTPEPTTAEELPAYIRLEDT